MGKIVALDFDGVICDGLAEYFYSSKLVYEQIWHTPLSGEPQIQTDFNYLRPIIETGWEMPLIIRALTVGYNVDQLFDHWQGICQTILANENLKSSFISQTLDEVRQKQINNDLWKWLELHKIYPDVLDKIANIIDSYKLFIITTKEGYFAQKLLESKGLDVSKITIIGKEKKRPKYESLRLIIAQEKVRPWDVCFIEDRLEALMAVDEQKDLQDVNLFLASWGYNTEKTRDSITSESKMKLLSLNDFTHGDIVNLFF